MRTMPTEFPQARQRGREKIAGALSGFDADDIGIRVLALLIDGQITHRRASHALQRIRRLMSGR